MSAQHTPGPWRVGGKYTHKSVLLNARGESIASGGNNRAVQGAELEASLVLAAAAPELLAALATLLGIAEADCLDDKSNVWRSAMLDAKSAIARSNGES